MAADLPTTMPGSNGSLMCRNSRNAVANSVAQTGNVLDAADVGLAGDDRADAKVRRVVLRRERRHRGAQHLVRLGVRRDQGALDHLGRSAAPSGSDASNSWQRCHQSIDLGRLERLQRPANASDGDRGPDQPVGIEQNGAQPEDPEHSRVVEPDRERGDHRDEQSEPRERAREDFKEPLLGMLRQRDRPGSRDHLHAVYPSVTYEPECPKNQPTPPSTPTRKKPETPAAEVLRLTPSSWTTPTRSRSRSASSSWHR